MPAPMEAPTPRSTRSTTPRRRTRPSPELVRLEKASEEEINGLVLSAEDQKWEKNEEEAAAEDEEEEETVSPFRPPPMSAQEDTKKAKNRSG